ncbi:hypothetical protein B0H65DRAFT_464380 [Neurospora tetraspora]|uniref:DUF6604 domain-containing protein n=1 Tax=Neurospora tetraspora TaxID=94610 RepID=A0AAE0MS07_9PEZI|nr:hypothetical protein B0H65DRAFT_464380 [Neurospora tetraspora]
MTMTTTMTMTTKPNSYFAYKRDISPLVYWVLQTSNALIWSLPSSYPDAPQVPLDNPEISLSSLVSLSKLIGKHVDPGDVPTPVLGLFQSVIDAIATSHATFQRIATKKPHPDVENGSAFLKSFVEDLRECLNALGGWNWALHNYTLSDRLSSCLPLTKEKLDCMVIKEFGALDLPEAPEADQDSEQETPQQVGPRVGHQRKQAKPGKGKKGRRKKDRETSKSKVEDTKKGSLDDVFGKEPLDSFDLTLDQDGTTIGCIMAVYDLFKECFDLRAYLQDVWYEVAYEGLNSAVAGALSNTARIMIQRSTDTMLADFPDKDSYQSVINTMSSVFGFNAEPEGTGANSRDEHLADVKEMFLVHAYHDLLDFVTDYQKNRNGKPTKRMMKEINNWNPDFDLQRATMEERLKWRRSYTINWLYDLLRVFSHRLEEMDAAIKKKVPDVIKRRQAQTQKLLGITEFAALIYRLATEKPGIDIREQVLPLHVFQLQCIVDSLAVTKGWTYDLLKGHVLIGPPPADRFRPMRDVDTFLHGIGDPGHLLKGHVLIEPPPADIFRPMRGVDTFDPRPGFFYGFSRLKATLTFEAVVNKRKTDNDVHIQELLEAAHGIGTQFLGKSPDLGDESRFCTTNSNGLWHYSPFLCGVGLVEALDLEFLLILYVWGHHREPVVLMHLYNMLLREGYLDKPIDLFESLQRLFQSGFFQNGKIPVADYGVALPEFLIPLEKKVLNNKGKIRFPSGFGVPCCVTIPYESFLVLLREAKWNVDKISDAEVPLSSLLAKLRIAQTEQIFDPDTGKRRLKETVLVKRAKAAFISEGLAEGLAEEKLLAIAEALEELNSVEKQQAEFSADKVVYTTPQGFSNSEWLDFMKVDIMADVDGDHPLCGLNLAWLTCYMIEIFGKIERELFELRNETLRGLCNDNGQYDSSKWRYKGADGRSLLIVEAMTKKDEQVLEVAARHLTNPLKSLSDFIHWDKLRIGAGGSSPPTGDEATADACVSTVEKKDVHMDQCVVIKGVAMDDGTVWVRN